MNKLCISKRVHRNSIVMPLQWILTIKRKITMSDAMIIILSGQPDPNLLPILDLKYKPKELYIVATSKMRNKVKPFCDALKSDLSIVRDDNIIDISDENSINESFTKISLCLRVLCNDNKSVVINFTGGTKPMSIGAFMAWKKYSDTAKAIYVDISSDDIIEYIGMDGDIPVVKNRKNECELDFEKYFAARKIRFEADSSELNFDKELASSFIKNMLHLTPNRSGYVSYINCLVSGIQDFLKSNKTNFGLTRLKKYECEEIESLLSGFSSNSLIALKTAPNNGKVSLKIEKGRKDVLDFLGGRWLEDYCYEVVTSIIPKNMCQENGLIYHADKSKNELDVLFFYKGTLHIIEVKSIIWKKRDNNQQNIVHKLKSLGDDFGIKTKLCVVSYYEVNDDFRSRAEGQNIKIIDGLRVRSKSKFKNELELWIGIQPK